MADSYKTVAELLVLNDANNLVDHDASDVLNDARVIRVLPAAVETGTTAKYLRYTTAPTVGFRDVNNGRENSKSVDTQISVDLKLMECSFSVDVAIAEAYKGGVNAFIAREAIRFLRQALFVAERQLFYGTVSPGDPSGFAGLGNESDLNSASGAMVVNAGGTTAGTGSSCWLIRAGPNDLELLLGYNGKLEIGESVRQQVAGATGWYGAYWTDMHFWLGLKRGSTYSACRIANLTADIGKGLTDDLIAAAIQKFPSGAGPTHIVMNRRSLGQLQASRTATNSTGAPAPFPKEAFGVPIIDTDAIVSTETLLT